MITIPSLLLLRARTLYVNIKRDMTHKVFVYGTLKRNEPNHHWLTNKENGSGKFISKGKTKNKYPLIIATTYNIPFLLHYRGDGFQVKGEIYEVDDKMLGSLDILENHPKYKVRELEKILIIKKHSVKTVRAWVYFLKKFKRYLLNKDKLDRYSSKGSHERPYIICKERSQRDPDYDYRVKIRD